VNAQLAVDLLRVPLDGGGREVQAVGHLLSGEVLGHQAQDFLLPVGERFHGEKLVDRFDVVHLTTFSLRSPRDSRAVMLSTQTMVTRIIAWVD